MIDNAAIIVENLALDYPRNKKGVGMLREFLLVDLEKRKAKNTCLGL